MFCEELYVYVLNCGLMVGYFIFNDSGDEIDCMWMGSGGYSIFLICEFEIIEFVDC